LSFNKVRPRRYYASFIKLLLPAYDKGMWLSTKDGWLQAKGWGKEGALENWNTGLLKKAKSHAVAEGQGLKHNKLLTKALK
jgi:hypothetical protein